MSNNNNLAVSPYLYVKSNVLYSSSFSGAGLSIDSGGSIYQYSGIFYGDVINGTTVSAATGSFEYLSYDYTDPEIEGWTPTTRDKVKIFAEIAFAYQGGVICFFNKDTRSFEIFEPSTGKFYTDKKLSELTVVEQVDPIINDDVEEVYKQDSLTGQVVKKCEPKYSRVSFVPEGQKVDRKTGRVMGMPKLKKRNK